MPDLSSIVFDSPLAAALAAVFCTVAIGIALLRRVRLSRSSASLIIGGLICLCLAAGGLRWQSSRWPRVAVMVDVSSSTRTARYHELETLADRLEQLLDGVPYTLFAFAEQMWQTKLADLPPEVESRRTVLEFPPADAIVLFSDARFELPAQTPPMFVVVDPLLEQPDDAAVTRLTARDGNLTVEIRNTVADKQDVVLTGAAPTTLPAPPGDTVLSAAIAPNTERASARIATLDPWPENNALAINISPPPEAQRWWITEDASPSTPAGWRILRPSELPPDATSYLGVSVIALDNIRADAIDRLAHERIEQYVRDFGGGLMIHGGDRAFAAGAYAGTALERLSPLSCHPPTPQAHWALLVDSSGSMSASIGDNTRWHFAARAMIDLIARLPPSDAISIGDFAREVRWWARDQTIEQLERDELVPRSVAPTGPTNLAPALRQLASSADAATPTNAIIITDGQAAIQDASSLAADLLRKRVRVSVLSHQPLGTDSALEMIVAHTGGADLAQQDPRQWTAALRMLLRAASDGVAESSPLAVTFTAAAPELPPQVAKTWNRTWLKTNATELASGRDPSNARVTAIAAWNIHSGAVLSAAFRPDVSLIDALAEIVAVPPRDPRFTVTWNAAAQLRVTVDAVDDTRPMNDLKPTVTISSERTSFTFTQPLPQTAPGRYVLTLPAPRRPVLATLTLDGRVLDRVAVAERYPLEFNAIGNDRAAMRRLAEQSGGAVIEPSHATPIKFPHRPQKPIALAPALAAIGVALLAAGVVVWKLS